MISNFFPSLRLAARVLVKTPINRSGLLRRQWIRSSSSAPYKPIARTTPRIPDIMLVYHAGTWRGVFLGVTQMATIIVFTVGTVDLAPRAWNDPEIGPWISAAVAVGSVIPLTFMALYSRSYVLSVHLRLPLHARASPVTLAEFTKNIPANCKMDISTMRLVPVPKTRQVYLKELQKIKPRFWGIANLKVSDVTANTTDVFKPQPQSTSFWRKPLKKFYIGENKLPAQKAVIWDRIWFRIPQA